jgi:hypothetical protein
MGGRVTTFAEAILSEARQHLGFREGPGNANPFSAFFGRPGEPWCADFVSYCATQAGHPLNECSVDALLAKMKREGRFRTPDPKPGDLVFFDWNLGDKDPSSHVGLVELVGALALATIEGNAANQVARRTYPLTSKSILGYATLESQTPGEHGGRQSGTSRGAATASARAGSEGLEQAREPGGPPSETEARASGAQDGAATKVALPADVAEPRCALNCGRAIPMSLGAGEAGLVARSVCEPCQREYGVDRWGSTLQSTP